MACIKALKRTAKAYRIQIALFDDASSDGTREAVLAEAPDTNVVHGDGEAFWNGGLHAVWRRAALGNADAFVWLNDDVKLEVDAVGRILRYYDEAAAARPDGQFILVGAVSDSSGRTSYSGLRRQHSPFALRFARVDPGSDLLPVDTFNGNFVVIPRAVVDLIGLNDPTFHHNLGDIDYGLRAKAAGVDVWLCPGFVGRCDLNTAKASRGFGSPALSLREQWRVVAGHHGLPFASWLHMTRRHSGIFFPLHFLLPYRRLLLPRSVLGWLNARVRG